MGMQPIYSLIYYHCYYYMTKQPGYANTVTII